MAVTAQDDQVDLPLAGEFEDLLVVLAHADLHLEIHALRAGGTGTSGRSVRRCHDWPCCRRLRPRRYRFSRTGRPIPGSRGGGTTRCRAGGPPRPRRTKTRSPHSPRSPCRTESAGNASSPGRSYPSSPNLLRVVIVSHVIICVGRHYTGSSESENSKSRTNPHGPARQTSSRRHRHASFDRASRTRFSAGRLAHTRLSTSDGVSLPRMAASSSSDGAVLSR